MNSPRPGGQEGLPASVYVRSGSRARRRRLTRRRRRRRKIVLLLLAAALAVIAVWAIDGEGQGDGQAAATVRITVPGAIVLEAGARRLAALGPAALRRYLGRRVPARRVRRRDAVVIRYRTDRPALERAVARAARRGGGTLALPERVLSASVRLPIVKQRLRNNCETAALSMLLAARGIRVDQLALQRQLPRSGPLDARVEERGRLMWGDPDRGFVGRPDGGGATGGYGVYQGPVRALARRRGARLDDLTRRRPATIYRRLLAGRPVMVWIGLSDGPFRTWQTPAGKRVTGNFGEHTVVLTGLRAGSLAVNDPLTGRRTRWTRPAFELMWRRLGRRALGV